MKIKVSVPATSANVGSGFDALGLAVTLYNTVTFEDSEVLEISASDGTRIPRGESNLVYRSAKGLFEKVGKQIPPLKITQTNPIPMARGLGSSSACIIAGLLGANRMLGDVLNTQELLTLATAIEGHPDIAQMNCEYIWYSSPNKGAIELMGEEYENNHVLNPSQEVQDRCEFFHDIDDTFRKVYENLWMEIKNTK